MPDVLLAGLTAQPEVLPCPECAGMSKSGELSEFLYKPVRLFEMPRQHLASEQRTEYFDFKLFGTVLPGLNNCLLSN